MNTNRRIARTIDTHTDWDMRALYFRCVCLVAVGATLISMLLCVTCK